MVAPAAYLRWVRGQLQSNTAIRILAALLLGICAAMVWAGSTADSELAGLLAFGGMLGIAVGAALVFLPGVLRALITAFLPAVEEERLPGWRVFGIAVTSAGFLLAYVGVLAL